MFSFSTVSETHYQPYPLSSGAKVSTSVDTEVFDSHTPKLLQGLWE